MSGVYVGGFLIIFVCFYIQIVTELLINKDLGDAGGVNVVIVAIGGGSSGDKEAVVV